MYIEAAKLFLSDESFLLLFWIMLLLFMSQTETHSLVNVAASWLGQSAGNETLTSS